MLRILSYAMWYSISLRESKIAGKMTRGVRLRPKTVSCYLYAILFLVGKASAHGLKKADDLALARQFMQNANGTEKEETVDSVSTDNAPAAQIIREGGGG